MVLANFKMLGFTILSLIFLFGSSVSTTTEVGKEKPCCCYTVCEKNYTTNGTKDLLRMPACQRGCRLYSLVFHISHQDSVAADTNHASEGCSLSCRQGYASERETLACLVGCEVARNTDAACSNPPAGQMTYSVLIEESDVLIQPGDSESNDVLNDPGLRKQFEKTWEILLETKTDNKLPETHFKNLPVTPQSQRPPSEHTLVNFKCPKFYGFDPKLEFRNGKIIIGDLYLFVGVFVCVIICFLIGHHTEMKNMTRQMLEKRKNPDSDAEDPLLLSEDEKDEKKDDVVIENVDETFETITLAFHTDAPNNISLKI